MKRLSLTIITLWLTIITTTQANESILTDTLATEIQTTQETAPRKPRLIRRIIRGFDRLDNRYIEPQHYVFTAMLQATYTYDRYRLSSTGASGQSITFAPDATTKIGPYLGWKWIFLGYTFSLGHSSFKKNKTEIDLSIYSSQIGVDLFYRRTGNDYKLRNVSFGEGIDTHRLDDISFDGVKAGITGISAYYIFNHGRFSYPAAFAQSTCQKISCGSWMAGIGYTKNSLELDYRQLQDIASQRLAPQEVKLDSGLMFNELRYHDFNISGGYAYNWVFSKNWLFCASGQVAIGYKMSSGEEADRKHVFHIENISPNLVGRFALVYNNATWYAGLSAIVHSNTYRQTRFSTNNTFGSMNMYVGYNFGLKKRYRKK